MENYIQTLLLVIHLKKVSKTTKTETKIIVIRRDREKKEESRFSFPQLSGAVCCFLNMQKLRYEWN
jgi:hypothetical protein